MIAKQVALALLIFGLVFNVGAQELGKPAPDFTLLDENGTAQSLSHYRGKIVVLEWINPECPFVKKHYSSSNMQNLQKDLTAKGVVWFSVNSSGEGKQGHLNTLTAQAERKKKAMHSTAILLDPDGKVGKLYGAKVTPHMFVVNAEGNLVYGGAIDDNSSSDPEDIPNSKNYVKAAVEEILSGKKVTVASSDPYGCSVKYKA